MYTTYHPYLRLCFRTVKENNREVKYTASFADSCAGDESPELCETRRFIIIITKSRQAIVVRDSYLRLRCIHRAIVYTLVAFPKKGA